MTTIRMGRLYTGLLSVIIFSKDIAKKDNEYLCKQILEVTKDGINMSIKQNVSNVHKVTYKKSNRDSLKPV